MFSLREMTRKDLPIINSWRANRELIDYLGAPYRYINEEVEQKWYENYISTRDTTIRCTIMNNNEEVIGLVSITNIDWVNRSGVLHVMIGESNNRGKGAGTYAVNEMVRHSLYDMNLNRLELSVLSMNQRAINLYEKVGFTKEGIKRRAVYKNGSFVDVVIMAILREEYLDRKCK